VGPVTITSGGQVNGLTQGAGYYVTVAAVASPGYLASAVSTFIGPHSSTIQLNAPTNVRLGYGTVGGSISVNFTASSNAPAGQTYSAKACTDNAMSVGCVGTGAITSGGQITGLTGGTNYYVTVTAVASTGYLASPASTVAGPQPATTALTNPTAVTLGYGTTKGSISVAFTAPSNAPGGQTYSAEACTNSAMSQGCVLNGTITSGGQITGLSATQGSAGTNYYVTVTAVASTGYLASTSPYVGPQHATSQVNAPTNLTVASSTTTTGAITATFTGSSGVGPSSYTATACTDSGMSVGCTTHTGYTSGAQITGLTSGTNYYVTITANPPTGYVAATTGSVGPKPAK